MNKEEKELLFKDICARLPYGVKVCTNFGTGNQGIANLLGVRYGSDLIETRENELHMPKLYPIEKIRPYLRPMSSMTEEEMSELMAELRVCKKEIQNCGHTETYGYTLVFQEWEKKTFLIPSEAIDWLDAHMFDYRGLVEKSLALEAPEGMYKKQYCYGS